MSTKDRKSKRMSMSFQSTAYMFPTTPKETLPEESKSKNKNKKKI